MNSAAMPQSATPQAKENPSSVARAAAFWDGMATGYAKKPVPDEDAYARTLERVAHYLSPSSQALEFGCGTGTTALRLAPHAGRIFASDVSPRMIDIAREKARAQGVDNVRFEVGTVSDAPQGAPVDVVMAFNFFHLLADLPTTFAHIHDLLPRGGLFVSKTPCIGEDGFVVRLAIPVLRAFGRAPYVNFLTKKALLSEVEAAGFSILETGLYPEKSHSLFIAARKD